MFSHYSYPKVFGAVISMLCLSAAGQEISPDPNLSKKDEPPKIEQVAKGIYRVENILLDKNRNLI
ncbi:uncharacterized protein METZ01_LOCUS287384, partial [marine metagenome]